MEEAITGFFGLMALIAAFVGLMFTLAVMLLSKEPDPHKGPAAQTKKSQ